MGGARQRIQIAVKLGAARARGGGYRVVFTVTLMTLLLLPTIAQSVSRRRRLDLTAQFIRFAIIEHNHGVEPTIEQRIRAEIVRIRGSLKQSYPSEDLEFLPPFVEVDQTLRYRVRYRGVYHSEIR